MSAVTAEQPPVALKPCPFCGLPIYRTRNKINPFAVCKTEDCFGARMPVVNVDQPDNVAAWNRRALVAEVERLREDAERWRALIASQRIRVMGSAGLYRDGDRHKKRSGGRMHLGVELWNVHDAPHPSAEFPQERSREMLIFYVDQIRAALLEEPANG